MRNVVFCAPFPMEATVRFARGLRTLDDVRLLGVWQQAPDDAGTLFDDVVTVDNALDVDTLTRGVEALARKYGPLHRITGILEVLQTQIAVVRRRLGVDGPDPETAERFRDKALMKDVLRSHGIPCARHRLVQSAEDAVEFVRSVGFPIVLKPPAGMGCKATWRIDDSNELRGALDAVRPSRERPTLAEEFLRGTEGSFETITIRGHVAFHSISHYIPRPLEVVETPWIQWVCILPRDISGPEYDEVRKVGCAVIETLGMESGITHMEWFRRPDGSIAVGEIAARPPGAQISYMTGLAHDRDIYRAWGRAVVDDAFDGPWERQYAAGVAFLRGPGRGRVVAIEGLDEAQKKVGRFVVEAKLPKIGQPKQDGYEGDGYVLVRHPDTDAVGQALKTIIETVQIRYA